MALGEVLNPYLTGFALAIKNDKVFCLRIYSRDFMKFCMTTEKEI